MISKSTKAILICNPSGKMYSEDELKIILDVAEEFSLYVISDEVYDAYVYDNLNFISFIGYIAEYPKIIVLKSFSKLLAINGWRVGYAVSTVELASQISSLNGLVNACAPSPLQYAVAKFLSTGIDFPKIKRDFQLKRDKLAIALSNLGEVCIPSGATYIFVDVAKLKNQFGR